MYLDGFRQPDNTVYQKFQVIDKDCSRDKPMHVLCPTYWLQSLISPLFLWF